MDGNGRWAEQHHLPRILGHKNAIKAVQQCVEGCREMGIEALTLYAFSTENWQRPPAEVSALMKLFEEYLQRELETLVKNGIRLRILGRKERLPGFVLGPLERALATTQGNQGMDLCLAVDYGSRDEILRATKGLAERVRRGDLTPEEIGEAQFGEALDTHGLPELDLVIRTSGEQRLSNFLLWQAAYAEFYFTPVLWPDFTKQELVKAITVYSERVRRMGKVHG